MDTPPLNEMDAPSTGPATASLAGYAYLWSGDQLIEEVPVYADGTVAYEQDPLAVCAGRINADGPLRARQTALCGGGSSGYAAGVVE